MFAYTGLIKMGQGFQLSSTLNANIITVWNAFTGHAFKLEVIAGQYIYPWRSWLCPHLSCYFHSTMIQDICFDSIFLSEIFKIHMLCMQVCNILEGQRYSRKLNERQVTSILRMACERPTQRQSSILEVNLITIRSLTIVAFTICAFKEVPTLLYLFR